MKKKLQRLSIIFLLLMTACSLTQVPENIPEAKGTWSKDSLVGNILLPAEETIIPLPVNTLSPSLYSGKLMVPIGARLINSEKSSLTVQVNKAGLLDFMGHQHVVAANDIFGWMDEAKNQGYLTFDLIKMSMDSSDLLKSKALPNTLTPEQKEATKQNMIKMLDAKKFPDVRVMIDRFDAKSETISARILLKDKLIAKEIPVTVLRSANGIITQLNGETKLKLSEFEITPFSALAGLLSVGDELTLDWKIIFN